MYSPLSRTLSGILTFFCLSGCTGPKAPPADRLVIALSSEAKTLDPIQATDAIGQRLTALTYSALVRINDDLEVEGDLAESWTLDKNTYRFQLQKGVYFHDQTPLTTKDLLISFSQYQQPTSPFYAQFETIESVSCDYDVKKGGWLEIKLKNFSAPLLKDLSVLRILSHKTPKKGEAPLGTGPYQVTQQSSQKIILKRHDNYYGPKAKTRFLEFKVVRDASTRFYKLYKGEIDIVPSDIPHTKVKVFRDHKNFKVVTQPGLSTTYLLFNLRKPPMSDKSFRQLLRNNLDLEPLITYKMEGLAKPAHSLLPEQHPHFLDLSQIANSFPKALLESDKKISLTLKTSNHFEALENGRILTHQLRKLGLNIEQQSYDWGTFYQDIKEGRFDIAIMQWVGIVDADILRTTLHSEMLPPGRNRGHFRNKKFDRLVELAYSEADEKKRKDLYHQAQKILAKELPIIPLWYEKQVAIINSRVRDYHHSTQGDFSGLLKAWKE